MGVTGSGIAGVIGGVGTAFGDFGSAKASEIEGRGDFVASADYLRAHDIAVTNEGLSQQSTDIQSAQLARKVLMTNATGQATAASNNLEGGSAGDILRMGIQQGSLAESVVKTQGAINKNAFAEQAEGYQAMSDSASAAGNAAFAAAESKRTAGVFSLLGAGAGLAGMFL